ncbi:Zinc-type alcohol dehydrogenase-like protein [Arthrobacter saudimassiliensis]|uniref:Zinc-type alcohol dehydrogenase-like protein n=1 Tax=Arthrobacter saudimassiliensis TaxID=1461584 RepID=A0A078MKP5_9MICC|nr:Zinc-type alcohol dehydrogenase-like protein [Arthrobacter saudimassiliensis]
MKAVSYSAYGGPEQLTYGDRPEPKLGPDSVLVRVQASSVNPVDWKLLAGDLDGTMYVDFPAIIGWDLAGVVVRPGPAAPEFAAGDEVIGYLRMDTVGRGTFAELVDAPVRALARKPRNLTWAEAGSLPLAGLAAYQCLKTVAAGEEDTVLMLNGSGGVGTLGIQIARAFGARVIATSGERHHDLLRSLGAEPVAYGEGLADRVSAVAPEGIDALVDFGGGQDWLSAQALLQDPDRLASLVDPAVNGRGGQYVYVRPDGLELQILCDLAEAGLLRPVLAAEYPLERAAEAVRLSIQGHTAGKIAVTVP